MIETQRRGEALFRCPQAAALMTLLSQRPAGALYPLQAPAGPSSRLVTIPSGEPGILGLCREGKCGSLSTTVRSW